MLDLHREKFSWLEKKAADAFAPLPVTPNGYTLASVLSVVVAAIGIATGRYPLALMFYLLASLLDFIDGAVARRMKSASNRGAYWDTVADRYVDAILLFSFLFLPLPEFFVPAYVWIFLVLFGSMMTTYAKAAAAEKKLNAELKGGVLSRAERIILYLAALVFLSYNFFYTVIILAVIAVLSNITAIQRIYAAQNRQQ